MKSRDGKGEIFRFEVKRSFTKKNLPMKRLAEYMTQLAALLGEPEHVHFDKLVSGSFAIIPRVDAPGVPKVRERLQIAKRFDAPADIAKPRKALDDALARDNGRAVLMETSSRRVILEFAGVDQQKPIGPVEQEDHLDGVLMWIGGHGHPVHAELQGPGGIYKCTLDREIAGELKNFLYGQPVRVHGLGIWFRDPHTGWELDHLRIHSFERLEDESLIDTVARLREVKGSGWEGVDDPVAELHRIRHGEA